MRNQFSSPPSGFAESSQPDRLDSWKEIAAYLKREVRTVQRWEKSASLPVHRVQIDKQGAIYAYKTELEAWYRDRRPQMSWTSMRTRLASRRTVPSRAYFARVLSDVAAILIVAYVAFRWFQPVGTAVTHKIPIALADEISTMLSKMKGIDLASRDAVAALKATDNTTCDIGRLLRPHYVVVGSVRKAGNQVRINEQLIDTTTGFQAWADDFTGDLQNVFSLQEQVDLKAAEALDLLSPRERQAVERRYTHNPQAYEEYWLSVFYSANGDKEKALAALQKSLDLGFRDFRSIEANAAFSPLRDDARFKQLLSRFSK